ncbi:MULTISPECIES: siderophore-interacting protein [Rhizobium]|uniref:Siderophore-interacting protein n=1 Tax=Rhizobium rhododendri TaxID=2506430 RepID=A0ABY8ICE9_9HYPH|nr:MULTISPECIES: siderophore-interacting protein [Rhizobium]MBZ5758607.1 siderophore-interacting protein [Rhizobium sp. VS19-DR96]MBZ5764563.1 siderophore-interacting protein [Rhizobium sp. VS19-DR129.2]MBZ5772106.1 siderophore-interacting protein [Rhizobium sp. VS19-DRK62.2]MBZ5783207.1 siderophore-interacting protein [Rhizobium sp. VS19-DR121]MBZ5800655.1 siderophore-interacting protein [Rhizobium sp. VS19-DR181]
MTEKHAIGRVRHELRRRLLTVTATERLTPNMLRITLGGEDLAGFVSAGYDDHVKLCFPKPGEELPVWPAIGPDATPLAEGVVASPVRDFTPRRYDADRQELTIDFAVHEAGPASDWAVNAVPGSRLGVGGPRGSFLVTDDFDWYLLVGDETALPAIGRRLEELRTGVRAIVIAAVTGPAEEQAFSSSADLDIRWLHRPLSAASDTAAWLAALSDLTLPDGDGYVWIAGETDVAKALRKVLVEQRGVPRGWIKSAGYWRHGSAGFHESHSD